MAYTCDNHPDLAGVFILTNLQTGDVLSLCGPCMPEWIAAMNVAMNGEPEPAPTPPAKTTSKRRKPAAPKAEPEPAEPDPDSDDDGDLDAVTPLDLDAPALEPAPF